MERGDADFADLVRRASASGAWDDLLPRALDPSSGPPAERERAARRLAEAAPAPVAAALLQGWDRERPRTALVAAAARGHEFAELADRLGEPWLRTLLAQEYVVRGADLRDARARLDLLEPPPLALSAWEPWRATAVRGVTLEALAWDPAVALPAPPAQPDDGQAHRRSPGPAWTVRADHRLAHVLGHWRQSRINPRWRTGDPPAITGPNGVLEMLHPERGLARLAWAAEHGGDQGVRLARGVARLHLWRFLAGLLELGRPADPEALAAAVADLVFWDWLAGGPADGLPPGPKLSMVVCRPSAGWCCSLQAFDGDSSERPVASHDLERSLFNLMKAEDWDRAADLVRTAPEDLPEETRGLWRHWITSAPAPYLVAHALQGPNQAGSLPALAHDVADRHRWGELGPLLTRPELAAWIAQERVAHGEDLRDAPGTHPEVLQLPLRCLPWEPSYLDQVEMPWERGGPIGHPWPPAPAAGGPSRLVNREAIGRALAAVAGGWTSGPRVAVVEGGPREALIGVGRAGRVCYWEADLTRATALLVHAAAWRPVNDTSLARGRLRAWQALAACTGLPWPVDGDELAAAAAHLRWWEWAPPGVIGFEFDGGLADEDLTEERVEEWAGDWLGLVVADPAAGWAAGLRAWNLR